MYIYSSRPLLSARQALSIVGDSLTIPLQWGMEEDSLTEQTAYSLFTQIEIYSEKEQHVNHISQKSFSQGTCNIFIVILTYTHQQ